MACEGPTGCDHGEVFRDLDALTKYVCGLFKAGTVDPAMAPREVRAWYRRHREDDRVRRADEVRAKKQVALRRTALLKLTPKERKALGVTDKPTRMSFWDRHAWYGCRGKKCPCQKMSQEPLSR